MKMETLEQEKEEVEGMQNTATVGNVCEGAQKYMSCCQLAHR